MVAPSKEKNAMMTRKNYVSVAAVIKAEIDDWNLTESTYDRVQAIVAIEEVARKLATVFSLSNPRFNRRVFLAACGVT